jgi:hypothetical protein
MVPMGGSGTARLDPGRDPGIPDLRKRLWTLFAEVLAVPRPKKVFFPVQVSEPNYPAASAIPETNLRFQQQPISGSSSSYPTKS